MRPRSRAPRLRAGRRDGRGLRPCHRRAAPVPRTARRVQSAARGAAIPRATTPRPGRPAHPKHFSAGPPLSSADAARDRAAQRCRRGLAGALAHRRIGAPARVIGAKHNPGQVLSSSSRRSLLGLKKGILFGGTSTLAPVFGLRPMRARRWRVWKLPNPRISTLSPDRRARTILSNMAQTTTSDSFLGISMA